MSINIIFGVGVHTNSTEVLAVRKYLEGAGLDGFWGLGPLEGAATNDTYIYPCDEDGGRDRSKARRKKLPNAKGELANVRGLKTILGMVKVEAEEQQQEEPAAPQVFGEDELDPSEWEDADTLLTTLLNKSAAAVKQVGQEAAEYAAWESLWDCAD